MLISIHFRTKLSMPKGRSLFDREQAKIDAYKKMGLSHRQVGKRIGRSLCVINKYVKKGGKYNRLKRSGRKPIITQRSKKVDCEKNNK